MSDFYQPKKNADGDLLRLAMHAILVTLLSLWLSPVLYQGGMALVEVSQDRETNRFIEWLSERAGRLPFERFFVLTFSGFAALSLLLLTGRIHSSSLPGVALFVGAHQCRALLVGLIGFGLVIFAGLGCALLMGGSLRMSVGVVLAALCLALLYECLFRGLFFGMLQKRLGTAACVAVTAVFFAGFRFMMPPPEFDYGDHESWSLGWQMAGKLIRYGLANCFALLVLPAWGILLGWARVRFLSIWPAVLLHAGWLFVMGLSDSSVHGLVSWSAFCAGFAWLFFVRERCVPDGGN